MKIIKYQINVVLSILGNTQSIGRGARGLARIMITLLEEQDLYEKEQITIYESYGCSVGQDGTIHYPDELDTEAMLTDITTLNNDTVIITLDSNPDFVTPMYETLLNDIKPLSSDLISMYDHILTAFEELTENKEEETNE